MLTARRCIALPTDSPCASGPEVRNSRDLTTVRVLVGDDAGSAVERARGRAVLVPGRGRPVRRGPRAAPARPHHRRHRAARWCAPPGPRWATTSARWPSAAAASSCATTSRSRRRRRASWRSGRRRATARRAGPPSSETSGQVVGVLSRGGPSCDAGDGYDVDTRADAFFQPRRRGPRRGHGQPRLAPGQAEEGRGRPRSRAAPAARTAPPGSASTTPAPGTARAPAAPTTAAPAKTRCMATRQSSTVCVQEWTGTRPRAPACLACSGRRVTCSPPPSWTSTSPSTTASFARASASSRGPRSPPTPRSGTRRSASPWSSCPSWPRWACSGSASRRSTAARGWTRRATPSASRRSRGSTARSR